jgi:1-deoxy-D-xylulose-5-phosphate reductoisomerase
MVMPSTVPHLQRVCILGSTGSIGTSTLDVIARHPDRFVVRSLTAHSRIEPLAQQCVRFRPALAVVADAQQAARLTAMLHAQGVFSVQVDHGPQALVQAAADPEADTVMAAIVGAAGLAPCLAAAEAGKRLLLANKEALVVGGAFFLEAVARGGATLIPIDSEHSAIFQCLPEDRSTWARRIDHIVLTASGGPFRRRDPATFPLVSPEEAVAHPNWVMGRKISVDSATMMNKALEVIEARWLFDLQPSQIRVVVHPQSIIHSMVVCRDNSTLAQLGTPDMRVPIAYGLSFPERIESGAQALHFPSLGDLSFEEPDAARYPGLGLAWECLQAAEGSTAVLNASNEIAVAAFLDRRIGFHQIHALNRRTLDAVVPGPQDVRSVEALVELDRRARAQAEALVPELAL